MKSYRHTALLLAAGVFAALPAAALEWRNTPSLELGAGSDTNVRLTPTDGRYVGSASLTAATELVGRATGVDLRLRPQLRSLRYDDPRELDRDDGFAVMGLTLGNTRRVLFVGADYARESTLTSELERTGFVEVDVERAQSGLRTSWQRQVRERTTVTVGAQAVEVDYGEAFLSPLVDYGYRVVHTSVAKAISERSTITVSGRASLVTSEALATETESRSIDLAWSRRISAALRGSLGAGVYDVESTGPFGTASTSTSFNFAIDGQWSRWSVRTEGARELRPDGRGTLVVEDALDVAAERRITEHLTIGAAMRGARVGIEGSSLELQEQDYVQASLSLQWRAAERWALRAVVSERSREVSNELRASGRQGVLSATYRGG